MASIRFLFRENKMSILLILHPGLDRQSLAKSSACCFSIVVVHMGTGVLLCPLAGGGASQPGHRRCGFYFRDSGWSGDLPVAPVLRRRKGLLLAQGAVSLSGDARAPRVCERGIICGTVPPFSLCLQENPDAATRQPDREDVGDG